MFRYGGSVRLVLYSVNVRDFLFSIFFRFLYYFFEIREIFLRRFIDFSVGCFFFVLLFSLMKILVLWVKILNDYNIYIFMFIKE